MSAPVISLELYRQRKRVAEGTLHLCASCGRVPVEVPGLCRVCDKVRELKAAPARAAARSASIGAALHRMVERVWAKEFGADVRLSPESQARVDDYNASEGLR